MSDPAALRRLMKGVDVLDVLESRARPVVLDEEPPAIPGDVETFYAEHIYWPHIERVDPDTGEPEAVRGINPMQAQYFRDRAAFRLDPDTGQQIRGADSVMKSRRIRFTSLCLGMCLWGCLRMPGSRYAVIFQVAKREILDAIFEQLFFALERFPPSWIDCVPGEDLTALRVGNTLRFKSGSRIILQSAGHSGKVAGQTLRGTRIDGLILSEPRAYAEPELVWAAAGKAVQKGWIVAESNPPTDREQWHAAEWLLTSEGRGSFNKAHFFPWHMDPLKRLPRGGPEFEQVHTPEFVAALPPGTVEEETALGLDDEQRAFRRRERFCGSPWVRKIAKSENPEGIEECFVANQGDYWLDRSALDKCRLTVCDPVLRAKLGTLLSVSAWRTPEDFRARDEQLIMFVDTAHKHGVDMSAIRARGISGCSVLEVHGRARSSELADAIVWVLDRWCHGVAEHHRYCVAVERNHATGKDLIDLLQDRGLKLGTRSGLYCQTIDDKRPGRRGKTLRRPGLITSAATRSAYLERLSEAVEGRAFDPETGELEMSPTVEFRSGFLLDELEYLALVDNQIQAARGHHDDLAIAEAGVLYLISKLGRHRVSGIQMGGGSSGPASLQRQGKKQRGGLNRDRRGKLRRPN